MLADTIRHSMQGMETRVLWESPIYRFRMPKGGNPDESTYFDEIVIDVTDSAPNFKKPSEDLQAALNHIFTSGEYLNIDSVLEFGAAKLKNIPFILGHQKSACAVEFRELVESKAVEETLRVCESHGAKYERAVFPHPFISHQKKYDMALLANVLPVMPVFAERLFVLDILYSKVRKDGYLLWYAQKEGGDYKKVREEGKQPCGDGVWIGKNKRVKTFYKYISVEDVDEMMALYGFQFKRKYSSSNNDIRLYQKTPYNLFDGLVSDERITQAVPLDLTIRDPEAVKPKRVEYAEDVCPVMPNPKSLSIESLYQERIRQIPTGPAYAEVYHRVISYAMARVFRGSWRNMILKMPVDNGIKIIDTIFTNCAEKGFFKNLRTKFDCNYIIIEVKNYKYDVENPEVDQLGGRLNKNHGAFGILVCRDVHNEDALYNRCATSLPNSCILFLTDKEIIEMLEYSRNGCDEEIGDIVDSKLRRLLIKKG
jgi:hypothetical protein